MNKIITVRYKDTRNGEDLYRNVETGRIYARQPANVDDIVFWYTTNKWSGGYEADCHIREGITMRIVDDKSDILFEETLQSDTWNGGTSAEKKGPFYREAVQKIADETAAAEHLRPYKEWKEWLMAEAMKHDYQGYYDNWLYCDSKVIKSEKQKKVMILGKPLWIKRDRNRHNVCHKEWDDVYIVCTDFCTEAICGYSFDS